MKLKIALVPWILLALSSEGFPATSKLITDSLVSGLSCSGLTRENVLSFVSDDAFSLDRQIPVPNWGDGMLGECWGLASAQRKLFYLARYGDELAGDPASDGTLLYALQLIEGLAPENRTDLAQSPHAKADSTPSFLPVDFRVFSVADPALEFSGFFNELEAGVATNYAGQLDFKSAVQGAEYYRFLNPLNIGFLLGSRDRDVQTNEEIFAQLQRDAAQKRQAILILRPEITMQHAVVMKKMLQVDGGYDLVVYDSNQPDIEPVVSYRDGEFYAPEIFGLYSFNSVKPVGVFITGESEMDKIESALFKYYQGLCAAQ